MNELPQIKQRITNTTQLIILLLINSGKVMGVLYLVHQSFHMSRILLKDIDTRAPKELNKNETKTLTATLLKELNELQNLLFAENKHALLIILQGMDASGKDGVIRDVLSYMNPQGVQVRSFKVPTEDELSHDFLWRVHMHAPAR